jgi:hypothetical protein
LAGSTLPFAQWEFVVASLPRDIITRILALQKRKAKEVVIGDKSDRRNEVRISMRLFFLFFLL